MLLYHFIIGAVDRYDKIKEHGVGFASTLHFHRWHKKDYLINLDSMCLNSYIPWNILTWMDALLNHSEANSWQFNAAVSEEFIDLGENFQQAETHWLAQADNSTQVSVAIASKVRLTCCAFRLKKY